MQTKPKKLIQVALAVALLAGAAAAYFLLAPPEAGEVKTAAPEAPVEAPVPPPNAALQPKPMTEEEMTAHQSQRRGTTAPEARSKE